MTGFFYVLKKQSQVDIKKFLSKKQILNHRGFHNVQIFDKPDMFLAVFLNKAQKNNFCYFPGNENNNIDSFFVMDGKIDKIKENNELNTEFDKKTRDLLERAWSLYQKRGIDAFKNVNGQYTILFKKRNEILAVRDPIGSKPLYIVETPDFLIFSSEMKATNGIDGSFQVLEPGCAFWTNGTVQKVERFFNHQELTPKTNTLIQDITRIKDNLRSLLESAVKRAIPNPTDARTVALLSGGLDSSVICALALKHVDILDAYVVAHEGSKDLVHALKFAYHYAGKINLHVISYTLEDMLRVIPAVITSLESYDAALIRSSIPMYIACSRMPAGTDVLLTGEGGDELFAGYSYLEDISEYVLDKELINLLKVEHATGLQRVDRIPYTFGIEARAPWFDIDLVKFSFQIPAPLKIKKNQDGSYIKKWIIRESFKDLLPDVITWRKKAKFSNGAGSELIMRDYFEKHISDQEFEREKKIAPGIVARSKEELHYWLVFKEHFKPSVDILSQLPLTKNFII